MSRKAKIAPGPAQPPTEAACRQAAAYFARTGTLLPVWNTRRMCGALIARGLASEAALRAAGLNAPLIARGEGGLL